MYSLFSSVVCVGSSFAGSKVVMFSFDGFSCGSLAACSGLVGSGDMAISKIMNARNPRVIIKVVFSILFVLVKSFVFAVPQCGQVGAESDISFSHSEQLISAIYVPLFS